MGVTLTGSQGLSSPQANVASPEQTATGKDKSNPFLAVMTCQKSYSSSTYYDSCSESGKWFQSSMDLTLSGSINLDAAVFVAVSILKALKTEDLSRKLEVNYVKFQFRGGLLVPTGRYIVPAGYIVPTGRTN
ncbi:hypothetical protein Tco_0371341 [Tanacetum coccineum]